MKIKAGFLGTRVVVDNKDEKDTKDAKSTSKDSGTTSGAFLGIQLSEDSALIQTFREAAKGQEPARAELVAQAKADIASGLLGNEEDMEQAINALFQEL
jgi:anti-sigma28 factor (negative regulator of flagellin synthesis)